MRKILDVFAMICLAFDVDWDKEYDDDDYVKAMRGKQNGCEKEIRKADIVDAA